MINIISYTCEIKKIKIDHNQNKQEEKIMQCTSYYYYYYLVFYHIIDTFDVQ